MKNSLVPFALTAGFTLSVLPMSIFGQGNIVPTTAPNVPIMKSLDQIEPRTPISSLPLAIGSSGGYYLTKSLSVSSTDGVTINASGVTLDLNGFEISSTEASPSHSGVVINGGLRNIRITNGSIRGNVTLSGSTFSGSGFANGIQVAGTAPLNAHVSDISVAGCLSNGINLGTSGLIESCNVSVIGGTAITANIVVNSNASQFGSIGIEAAASATGCYAVSSTTTSFYGINAGDMVVGCVANCNATSGQGAIETQVARDCWASANGGAGDALRVNTAENCNGFASGTGSGIHCFNNAINCYGTSVGNAAAVDVDGSALNCYGVAFGNGAGIVAASAANCYGKTSGSGTGIGLDATSATNCHGETSGSGAGLKVSTAENCDGTGHGSGSGIVCDIAINCQAFAVSATGLSAHTANNCNGTTVGSNAIGLFASEIATNCFGSGPGFGVSTFTAIGCVGQTTTGTGIKAIIGNSCHGLFTAVGGTPENITNKYNMP